MAKGLPSDVIPVSCALDVKGDYAKLRTFLYKVQLSPRLMTVQQARWLRDDKAGSTTMASITLMRYVKTQTEVEKQAEAMGVGKDATPERSTGGGMQ